MQAPSKELLDQLKSGDREALGELYLQYRQSCYAFALLILKNHEDAEDAVQNTFIRMHGSIRTLKSDEAFVLWMEKILNRECLRIAQRRFPELNRNENIEDIASHPQEEFMLPESYAERIDLSERLKAEIEKLPLEQRQTLLLFYYHGLSLKDIADVTESNISTVKSRLRYARKNLKESIEQQEKKYGDKFYGVPVLPFREILTRVLDREKEKKKTAALLRSLDRKIDALNAGYGGKAFSGKHGLHTAKVAAGILAAILALGAAAGSLTGAVVPEYGRGWSNMPGGTPEQNPEQIASTEPGERIEAPVQPPERNDYAPANAEYTAPNTLDTPQNNNNQAPAVQPTQSAQNTPAPTQGARTADPTQPSPPPTQNPENTPTQSKGAYQAYRTLLQQNAQAIKAYNWQYSDGSYPIALADIYGDNTPELLFFSASGSTATLSAYTYDGTKTVSLLNSSALRSDAAVNDTYFLFQKSGDKRLYLYSADENDYGTSRCLRFDESGGKLTATELCSSRMYPSDFTVGGKAVSTSAYADYEANLFSDISSMLIRNDMRGMCSQEAYDAWERHASHAMTLNEALAYLEEQ